MSELTFNWLGFLSAMASNLTFGFRAVWSKKCARRLASHEGVPAYIPHGCMEGAVPVAVQGSGICPAWYIYISYVCMACLIHPSHLGCAIVMPTWALYWQGHEQH